MLDGGAYLLDVVEVDKEKRIRCQADGCGHAVYARIHVVLDELNFVVLGGDCFHRLYGRALAATASYYGGSSSAPTRLTEELRLLLDTNTAEFIERLELRRQQLEGEARRRRSEMALRDSQLESSSPPSGVDRLAAVLGLTGVMPEARARLQLQFPRVDLTEGKWPGRLLAEARAILRQNAVAEPREE